ncbi:hypothetical protein BHM03_00008149 [Ensete ventricosum]|nr:hypothetical protein BHM03_00008149 [Ensete ventricosum]
MPPTSIDSETKRKEAPVMEFPLPLLVFTSLIDLYSNSNGVSVPESLIFIIAYHTATSHHVVRGPCGEARAYSRGDVDLTHLTCVRSTVRPLTPPCLCQADFLVSGRSRWRASCPRARGRGSQVNICHISYRPRSHDVM